VCRKARKYFGLNYLYTESKRLVSEVYSEYTQDTGTFDTHPGVIDKKAVDILGMVLVLTLKTDLWVWYISSGRGDLKASSGQADLKVNLISRLA